MRNYKASSWGTEGKTEDWAASGLLFSQGCLLMRKARPQGWTELFTEDRAEDINPGARPAEVAALGILQYSDLTDLLRLHSDWKGNQKDTSPFKTWAQFRIISNSTGLRWFRIPCISEAISKSKFSLVKDTCPDKAATTHMWLLSIWNVAQAIGSGF